MNGWEKKMGISVDMHFVLLVSMRNNSINLITITL